MPGMRVLVAGVLGNLLDCDFVFRFPFSDLRSQF